MGSCRVVAIANTKGGVGKSTLATNLAVEAATAGVKVLLVDSDPQASCALFAAVRDEDRPAFRVVQLTKPILHREIPGLSAPYDLTIVDTGREQKTFRSALTAARTILVPVVPSAYDFWATEDVFATIDEVAAARDEIRIRVLLNLVIPRTRIAREALGALAEMLEEFRGSLLKTRIHSRVAWKVASSRGLAVTELEPRGLAARELRSLSEELRLIPVGGLP